MRFDRPGRRKPSRSQRVACDARHLFPQAVTDLGSLRRREPDSMRVPESGSPTRAGFCISRASGGGGSLAQTVTEFRISAQPWEWRMKPAVWAMTGHLFPVTCNLSPGFALLSRSQNFAYISFLFNKTSQIYIPISCAAKPVALLCQQRPNMRRFADHSSSRSLARQPGDKAQMSQLSTVNRGRSWTNQRRSTEELKFFRNSSGR